MLRGRVAGTGLVLAGLITVGCTAAEGGSAAPASTPSPSMPAPVATSDARVVPLTEVQLDRIHLDSPDWMTTTPGALWVKLDNGTVVRIDPTSGKVKAEVEVTGPEDRALCQGLGSSGDAVWTCTPFGTLARIDPQTDVATNVGPARARGDQGHYVALDERLWMVDKTAVTLVGLPLDGSGDEVSIPLGYECAELALQDRTIWATCPTQARVLRVDVDQRAVTGEVALSEPRTLAVADQVFVTSKEGVAQIDPSTLQVEAVYAVHAGLGAGLWADADGVWVRCDGGPFLVGIDPQARRVTSLVTAEDLPSGGNVIAIDGDLWATAYDDAALVRLRPPV